MEVNQPVLALRESLPKEPMWGVHNVVESMATVHRKLRAADLRHIEPFAMVYHGVTEDVQEDIETAAARPHLQGFKEIPVLHRATGHFWYHGARQLDQSGPEKHWKPLIEDERARHVDVGTQLWLGMIAHIGGDLARTVHEAQANESYIRHDYPLINTLLEKRAHRVSEYFVPLGNPKLRRHVTDVAMVGIRTGRMHALRDYRKMQKAKSEDERMHIIERSHERTARIANFMLSTSYQLNRNKLVSTYLVSPPKIGEVA